MCFYRARDYVKTTRWRKILESILFWFPSVSTPPITINILLLYSAILCKKLHARLGTHAWGGVDDNGLRPNTLSNPKQQSQDLG